MEKLTRTFGRSELAQQYFPPAVSHVCLEEIQGVVGVQSTATPST